MSLPMLHRSYLKGLPMAAAFVFALIASNAAHAAAPGQDISASPTSVEQAIDAGSSITGSLSAIDDSDQATAFQVYTTPYGVSGEDYKQSFQLEPGFNDASTWFRFDFTKATIQPHGQLQVPYKVTVPAGVGPGGYYATVFFQTQPVASATTGVQVQRRVGVIFYLRVNGAVSQSGRVASWDVPFWQTEAPLTTAVRLQNDGNIYYQANVTMKVNDLFGRTKFTAQTERYVLPKTIRRIPLTWPGVPKFGVYGVSGTASILGQVETLPTHYVLVMSQLAFLEVVAVLIFVITILVLVWRRSRR